MKKQFKDTEQAIAFLDKQGGTTIISKEKTISAYVYLGLSAWGAVDYLVNHHNYTLIINIGG